MSDTDILLGGFSLFGGRGEYMGKIKVLYRVQNCYLTCISFNSSVLGFRSWNLWRRPRRRWRTACWDGRSCIWMRCTSTLSYFIFPTHSAPSKSLVSCMGTRKWAIEWLRIWRSKLGYYGRPVNYSRWNSHTFSCFNFFYLTKIRVTFTFKPSKKSNNGTDVNAGQLPQILFRVVAHDAPPSKPHASIEAVHSISSNFPKVVTPVNKFLVL